MHTHPIRILVALAALSLTERSTANEWTFEKDVRPILKAHCFHCHGESGVTEGSLDVRLRHWIVAGGDSGAAIEPGVADESLLLERIVSGEMPPGDKQLSADEVETIRQWIQHGAVTARAEPETLESGDYFTEEERSHWAFQPIRRPDPPLIADPLIVNPIDAFLLQRLQQQQLSFSRAADRITLIRRATFDLWGLPPEPAMVDQFVADQSHDAYAKLIDRLLADPRYGQRWGRHWLDVAGYADSDGYTNQDTEREFAYLYRDYVIDGFNDDKPWDRFLCEQLAGDELAEELGLSAEMTPQRVELLAATGFLRMAPDGTSGGAVDRDLAINDSIADTIEIVTTSLLGLTVGCARCHDHRYDPISQADYYRLRAVFAPALDSKKWQTPNQRRLSLYTEAEKQQRAAIEQQAVAAEQSRTQRQQEHIERTLMEELLVAPDEVRQLLRTAYETPKDQRTPPQVALLEEFPNVGNISNGSLYLYAEQRSRRASEIEKAADQREARYIEQAQQTAIENAPAEDRDALRQLIATPHQDRNADQQALAAKYPDVVVTATTLQQHLPEAFAEVRRYRQAALECRQQDAKTELAKLQDEINAIRASAPAERFVRVLSEPANHLPATHLFIRGDHNQPGPQLDPAELTVLRGADPVTIAVNDPDRSTSGRRLAYARHLVGGQHPLSARVLMNRVWLHHFGRGIVDTPGDFGRLGSLPTHPQLLDWLADELIRGGWQLKRMHRLIMLSHAYQQESVRSPQLDRIDPDNRLYARMSVRRLEAEAIRDAMLAASGDLLDQLHGPPIPVKEDSVGQIVLGREMLDGERKPSGQDQSFAGASRRSVYVQVRRSRPLAVLDTFDLPSVSPNCTERNSSNVAIQSLLMMNSQIVIDLSDRLAQRVITDHDQLSDQLAAAWQRCFASDIDNSVLTQMSEFVSRQATVFQARDAKLKPSEAQRMAVASACQAMLSANEFLYID